MAGVMGGLRTACTADTVDVLFEAAFFPPSAIAGRGRRYGLVTDAGQRFERGVDPVHQERAQSNAPRSCCSKSRAARPVPLQVVQDEAHLPRRAEVALRRERIAQTARHADRRQRREGARSSRSACASSPNDDGLARHAAVASLRHLHRSRPHRRTRAHRRIRSHRRSGRARRQKVRAAAGAGAGRRRRRSRSWPRAATRKPSPTRSSIRRCRTNCFPAATRQCSAIPISSDMARHARVAVAGPDQGRARQSAPPAGPHSSVRARRAFRTPRRRDRSARRHRDRRAPPGAVGRRGHAGGFLRREAGSRSAVCAHRRAGRVRLHRRHAAVSASRAEARESRGAARPSAG